MTYRPDVDSIIFDLDGTLWDASESSALAWSNVCREIGINKSFSGSDIKAVSGLPFDKCVDLLFDGISEPNLKARLDRAEKDAIMERGGTFYEGLQDGIKRLAEGYKLFLVSNCQDWYLQAFLNHSGLRELFVDSLCHGTTQLPKRDNIRSIISRNKLRRSVYVGDTHWDQEAAFYAGSKFIFTAYGFGKVTVSCPQVRSFTELVDSFTQDIPQIKFDFRKLNSNDFEAAQAFYRSVGYHQEILPENLFYGAFKENDLVGIVRLAFENGVWVLRGMQIDPALQFFGLGTRLIKLLENDLSSDCYCLPHGWLDRFYGQIGFKTVTDMDTAPRFLYERLIENKKKYPQLILMKRSKP